MSHPAQSGNVVSELGIFACMLCVRGHQSLRLNDVCTKCNDDCQRLVQLGLVPPTMSRFLQAPSEWAALIDSEAWDRITHSVHFDDSVFDTRRTRSAAALAHACPQCHKAFPTTRALECNRRMRHGDRIAIKAFLHTSRCPCCKVDFRERARLLNHVSDRRRPKCANFIRANVAPMSAKGVRKFDREVRAARARSRRSGSLQLRAWLPALKRGKEFA